jgi:lipopolysaccharide/colanic/teichoic acid biosynthesis glycosyltransferase
MTRPRYRKTTRVLDLVYALILSLIIGPMVVCIAVVLLVRDGRPVFYRSERMHSVDKPFYLWKFRTMVVVADDSGVSGGDKSDRITATGRWLRRKRFDELPQLWNILKGDIGFVGPRPPLRQYTEKFPGIYEEVLKDRPGVSGLASVTFHAAEERILAEARTREETERLYCQRCVPRKARLDLLYSAKRTPCSDMRILLKTVFRGFPMHDRAVSPARRARGRPQNGR